MNHLLLVKGFVKKAKRFRCIFIVSLKTFFVFRDRQILEAA
jgi:hypothetical protein